MRDAVRNKERWKRRRTPTQYPSTYRRDEECEAADPDGEDQDEAVGVLRRAWQAGRGRARRGVQRFKKQLQGNYLLAF